MYMRIFSDPATRCARSPDNRARLGDSDGKVGRREGRTSAMKRGVRAAGEASARLSGRPPGKKLRAHLSASCDRKLRVPQDVPFLGLGPANEMIPARRKPPTPCGRLASIDSNGAS